MITANFVIVAVLAGVLAATALALRPSESGAVPTDAIYSGDPDSGSVTLMVNVYEGTEYVRQIAELIKARGFSTTFFVGGKWAERNGDALLRLAADGFEIGNHGYLHRDHAKLDYKQNVDEILLTETLIASILTELTGEPSPPVYMPSDVNGDRPVPKALSRLFAPPSGSFGNATTEACKNLGYKVIMWSRDTIDWRDHDAEVIYQRAVKDMKAGDLILMHPTACTVQALPRILDYIESAGLRVDCVSKTLSAQTPDPAA